MKTKWGLLLWLCLLSGCATSTIETRRQERQASFDALPPEQRKLVEEGVVRVGMPADAVYIAWGAPSEVVESESESGLVVTWMYHGQWMEETRYWTYQESSGRNGPFLERRLVSDYAARQYIRAEIDFVNGKVVRWRTLPRPVD